MGSRFYLMVLVYVLAGVCLKQTNAQDGHKIDLRPLVPPPFATANTPTSAPTAEQTVHDRIINRRLQYRQRRSAMLHVTRLRRFAHIDFDTISKAYHAKKNALFRMVTSHRARQQQVTMAKQRAVTEVKAIAAAMRARFEAEERSMIAVIRKMREENPEYADQALRQAVTATEKSAGETITETENLPLLSKTINLSYIDPIRRAEKRSELPAKLTIPIRPTTSAQSELKPSIPLVGPPNAASPANKQLHPFAQSSARERTDTIASLRDTAKQKAFRDHKKQEALAYVKRVKQQNRQSEDEKAQKLRDLVELYVTEEISSDEYLRRRELIHLTTPSKDKE